MPRRFTISWHYAIAGNNQGCRKARGRVLSTVSAVMNHKDIVSGPTRQRVLDAIATLQYQPNHFASNLARRQTSAFGLIVSSLLNPFFAETAQAIEDEARLHGYGVTLTATNFRLNYCGVRYGRCRSSGH